MADIYWKENPNLSLVVNANNNRKEDNTTQVFGRGDTAKIEEAQRIDVTQAAALKTVSDLMANLFDNGLVTEHSVKPEERTGDYAHDMIPDRAMVSTQPMLTKKKDADGNVITKDGKPLYEKVCYPVDAKKFNSKADFELLAGKTMLKVKADILHTEGDVFSCLSIGLNGKGEKINSISARITDKSTEKSETIFYNNITEILASEKLYEPFKRIAEVVDKEYIYKYKPDRLMDLKILLDEEYSKQNDKRIVPIYERNEGKIVKDADGNPVVIGQEEKNNNDTYIQRHDVYGNKLVVMNRDSKIYLKISATKNGYFINEITNFNLKNENGQPTSYHQKEYPMSTADDLDRFNIPDSMLIPIVTTLKLDSRYAELASKLNSEFDKGDVVVAHGRELNRSYAVFCNDDNSVLVKDRVIKNEWIEINADSTSLHKADEQGNTSSIPISEEAISNSKLPSELFTAVETCSINHSSVEVDLDEDDIESKFYEDNFEEEDFALF